LSEGVKILREAVKEEFFVIDVQKNINVFLACVRTTSYKHEKMVALCGRKGRKVFYIWIERKCEIRYYDRTVSKLKLRNLNLEFHFKVLHLRFEDRIIYIQIPAQILFPICFLFGYFKNLLTIIVSGIHLSENILHKRDAM